MMAYQAETCCFTSNLRIYIFYIRYELCFDYPPTYLVRLHNGDDTP